MATSSAQPVAKAPNIAPAASEELSELLAWDDVVKDLLELPGAAVPRPRPFVLEGQGQALSQASYQSDTVTVSHAEPEKALPLWGSVLLARDRTEMEQLLTAQTQGGLVKLVAGRSQRRRQFVVLRGEEEALLGDMPATISNNSAQSSAAGMHSFAPPQDVGDCHADPLLQEDMLYATAAAAQQAWDQGKGAKKQKKHRRRKARKAAEGEVGASGSRSANAKAAESSAGGDEGMGESAPFSKRKWTASAGDAAGSSSQLFEGSAEIALDHVATPTSEQTHPDDEMQHSDTRPSVRQRRTLDITWFMALRDASQAPELPHTDVSKLLPTSYEGDEGALEGGKGSKGEALEGPSSKTMTDSLTDDEVLGKGVTSQQAAVARRRRREALEELRLLYPSRMQLSSRSMCFSRLRTEAAFYVSRASSWAVTHLVTHTIFTLLLLAGLTYTVLPIQCDFTGTTGPYDTPGASLGFTQRMQQLMLAVTRVAASAVECGLSVVKDLLAGISGSSTEDAVPSKSTPLHLGQQWMLAHLIVHAVICLPLRLLYALPKPYRLLMLETVTQAVHVCTYIAHSWCPLCSCQAQHHLLPNSIMLCRNWLYLFMFPTRWRRSMWTQLILLTFTLSVLLLDPSSTHPADQDPSVSIAAAKSFLAKAIVAVPVLANLKWHKIFAVLSFVERALPWIIQGLLQCTWLYVSELIQRSAFLVRRAGRRTAAQ